MTAPTVTAVPLSDRSRPEQIGIVQGLSRLRKWYKRLVYRMAPARLYMWMYARDTDRRVREDPGRASGHPGTIMGPKVLSYMKAVGLQPHHRLLDFGCGTLRTGRYLIDYLDSGRYAGVDISRGAIAASRDLIANESYLVTKAPQVWRVAPHEPLDLPWVPDFILCHSVFTHLPRTAAREAFRKLHAVMTPGTTLVFTVFLDGTYGQRTYKDVRYPASEIVGLAAENGIEARSLQVDLAMRQTVFVGRRA
jgi:SAM-dependent methyltransferase